MRPFSLLWLVDFVLNILPDGSGSDGQIGQALIDDGAQGTVLSLCSPRCFPLRKKSVHSVGQLRDSPPQVSIQRYPLAAPRLPVVQISRRNRDREHLLKADGLCAQLDGVAIIWLRPSPFVLHRSRLPEPGVPWQGDAKCIPLHRKKLDYISLSAKAECVRDQWHRAGDHTTVTRINDQRIVRPVMQMSPFHCTDAFGPLSLNVDQSPLAFAKRKVLDSGQRQQVLFSVGRTVGHSRSISLTPAGRAARSAVTL